MNLGKLVTEQQNKDTKNIDKMSTYEIVKTINNEDKKVAFSVEKALPDIARAIDMVAESFRNGGKLFYVGAGTSGRLAIADAAECHPTFGVPLDMVQGIIAGGDKAIRIPIEGSEDYEEQGGVDLKSRGCCKKDVVMGISSSGRTPYVMGALKAARNLGAKTIGLANNMNSELGKIADCKIEILTGPEVIMGSTRMKAGTSQKMVLNMITTTAMIRIGKVYSNLMVDMLPTNEKLEDRAVRLLANAADVSLEQAKKYLGMAGGSIKIAIVMIKKGIGVKSAEILLNKSNGIVSKVLE